MTPKDALAIPRDGNPLRRCRCWLTNGRWLVRITGATPGIAAAGYVDRVVRKWLKARRRRAELLPGVPSTYVDCPACDGRGRATCDKCGNEYDCKECDGRGASGEHGNTPVRLSDGTTEEIDSRFVDLFRGLDLWSLDIDLQGHPVIAGFNVRGELQVLVAPIRTY